MNTLVSDLRLAARQLTKRPGLALTIIGTLALGIGANTAIFSVVNRVLLRPLPYDDPHELVLFRTNLWGVVGNPGIASGELKDFREQSRFLEDVGSLTRESEVVLTGGVSAESVTSSAVTSNLFGLLGVEPFMGRWFTPEEGESRELSRTVAIISHGLWQRRYGEDPDIIGKTVSPPEADSTRIGSLTIVGVTKPGFSVLLESETRVGPSIDLWTVQPFNNSREFWGYRAIGRLADGASLEQAQAEVTAISTAAMEQYPDRYVAKNMSVEIHPLHGDLVQNVQSSILILQGAVGLVLLIACINTAGLLIMRTQERESELAVRAALGAGRGRIIRQVMTESLGLALLGGFLGLVLGVVGVQAMLALQPGELPRGDGVTLDRWVLGFAFLATLVASGTAGLLPALKASRPDLQGVLKGGKQGPSTRRRMQGALVVFEVAFSLVLLIGAGLLVRTFASLRQTELGFDPASVLTMDVPLPRQQIRDPLDRQQFYEQLVAGVETLPGVQSASVISALHLGPRLPIGGPYGDPDRPETLGNVSASHLWVLPGFFQTMGMELTAGRTFEPGDMEGIQSVAVIDQTIADRLWPSQDPIGEILSLGVGTRLPEGRPEVVGVVAAASNTGIRDPGLPQIYLPYPTSTRAEMFLVIRGEGDMATLTDPIRSQIAELGSAWPVRNVRMMQSYVDEATASDRFTLILMSVMGGLALVLASIGIYSVIAYLVSLRRHETGIRMALGAGRSDVLQLNLREGVMLVSWGVALGLAGAVGMSRFMDSLLFEVTSTDPATYAVVALLFIVVGLSAAYVPAAQATHVDPVEALRGD